MLRESSLAHELVGLLVRALGVDWNLSVRLTNSDLRAQTSRSSSFFSVFPTVVSMFFQRVFWVSGHDSQGHLVFACTGQSKYNVRSLWVP
jgi:hypothetical protein